MRTLSHILIWLLPIVLGIVVGAGLYEARVVVPLWAGASPETWHRTGIQFWAFVSTGPLTLILLASLIVVWWYRGAPRKWWLAALALLLVERTATFAYFIPTMVQLQDQPAFTPQVAARLETWRSANVARHLVSISAWLLSLRALYLLGGERALAAGR